MMVRLFSTLATAGVVGVTSCGGIQIEDPQGRDSGGSAGESVSLAARGGAIGDAGRGGAIGAEAGRGGASSSSSGGVSVGSGGRGAAGSPVAGTGGRSVQVGGGAGGSAGREDGGQAGVVEPGEGGAGGERPVCSGEGNYEAPRPGVNCGDWWDYLDPTLVVKVDSATTLEECKAACDARPDCTAVSDLFARQAGYPCRVSTGECRPTEPIWAGEDAGLEYERVCPGSGACQTEFLGFGVRCDAAFATYREVPGATSFLACRSACLDDSNCVSVLDHSYLNDLIGCFLNVAPCDQMVPTYDTGTLHRKICD
jgi:hypothetical protein